MSVIDAVRRANAKAAPEESVGLRVAVLVAILAATMATLAQGVGGPELRVASTLGIAGGFVCSHWARHRSSLALKAFLAVGVMLAFAQFLHAVAGVRTGAFNEVQLPLAELFLWVQFLHSLDVPARRDLLFSLLSSLVLIAVAGVLSLSLNLGINLVVWAAAAVVALLLAYRSEVRDLPRLVPGAGVVGARTRPAGIARGALAVVLLVAVVGGAAFLVVPAAGAGRAVAFPAHLPRSIAIPTEAGDLANPSLGRDDPAAAGSAQGRGKNGRSSFGYFGFSATLDTAARGRPDDTIVLKVKAGRPDFWRGQTFDTWNGREWSQSHVRPKVISGDPPISLDASIEDDALGILSGEPFTQTVYVAQPGPNLIFAAYAPSQLYFSDARVFQLDDGTIRTGVEMPRGSVYTVVSRRPAVTADRLREARATRASGVGAAAFYSRYTRLDATTPPRVSDLAAQLTASAPTTYDKVLALESWMGDHTTYTLDIPHLPAGEDAVERYLFVDRKGFCEQIASALVVMLRSQGIPARVAVGFAPGERNPFTGLWEVRASDAHAWAEVWFPNVGWQPFDPTASVPFSGDPFSSSAGAGLFRFIGERLPSVPAWVAKGAVGVALVGTPLVFLVWALTRQFVIRRRRRHQPWAAEMLDRMERAGTHRGRPRRPAESARQYARALSARVLPDERLEAVGIAIETDAFSPDEPDPTERAWAEDVLAAAEAANSG